MEQTYEEALCVEFEIQELQFQRQVALPLAYKGKPIGDYRIDLMVENSVAVEIKSVERHNPVYEAQVQTYLRITGERVGLLINFNSSLLKNGIKRVIL